MMSSARIARALPRRLQCLNSPSQPAAFSYQRYLFLHSYNTPLRTHATATSKQPALIDLSRDLYHRAPAHPSHPPIVITPWDTHAPKKAGNTILRSASYYLSLSDHAGTHVDAPKHFDPTPGALSIDQMPLSSFYTPAICLDLSHAALKAAITVPEMEDALLKSGETIQEGDTVLLYMAYNKRVPFDDPRWQHDFPGLALESVHWLADRGCKIFGVEAVSPAPEGELNYQAHNACGKRGITHIEGLDHLEDVLGKGRFRFVGFPLKIRGGSGGPMRAVAIFE
jgi:kynurenine formamidase